jgi:integrase
MTFTQQLDQAFATQDILPRTRDCYRWWIRKFYAFARTPAGQWNGPDAERWIHQLDRENYSPTSRKQALCALVFAFKHVLKRDLGQLNLPPFPVQRKTLRTIPSRDELGRIFAGLRGQARLMAGLMYGAGLRVSECCQLRVQDIDLEAATIRVHQGKGDRSRLTVLPEIMIPALRRHIAWRSALHEQDLAEGAGLVELPGRLAQKYQGAPRELRWQYLFPSTLRRGQYRWHATDEAVAKAMRAAVKAAGIVKRVTPHTLRHAFATHAMRAGNDPETIRTLLGHESLETTMIYLHADHARGVSPLDLPPAARPDPLAFSRP